MRCPRLSRSWNPALALVVLATTFASSAAASSCPDKQVWQRQIVRDTIQRWFREESRPADLLDLVQAEQGMLACAARGHKLRRLHTSTLPRGLQIGQLGAVLLANELAWSGLIPSPEEGLAGRWFPIKRHEHAFEAGE